ncbi:hypothetical protein F5Y19DRAFT_489551 [Xylariaceae sp. FL1651]|nr:hypothetical protein F5Y19DRAFT_489551 [Xylariaceae sp. FL1651]
MPTFVTAEQFTCGHALETLHGSYGSDGVIIKETIPVPTRCLGCICHMVLGASCMPAIPRSYIRDLEGHLRVLTISANVTMKRELKLLSKQVQCLDDIDEFRKGVIALAGYPELGAHFVF